MYLPRSFAETHLERLQELIRAHPFGTLVVRDDGGGVEVVHVPFVLDASRGPHGTLRAHVARANPVWRLFDGRAVLVVFAGPHGYVSPRWYSTPDQVPTWNYAVVHAHGVPRPMEASGDLRGLLSDLASEHEAGAEHPWSPSELPPSALDEMLREIVGFTLPVARLEGKFKLSQNREPVDRAGVLRALRTRGGPDDLALLALMESSAQ